jgi:hypothetical protein
LKQKIIEGLAATGKKELHEIVGSNPLTQAASFKARIQGVSAPFRGASRRAEAGLSTTPPTTTRRSGT